jgi:electron transfer flavoprotein alpha subunit
LSSQLNRPLAVALLGEDAAGLSDACFAHGAAQVYVGNDPVLASFSAGTYAAALAQIAAQADADTILIGSTRCGRGVAPRLAQKLSAGCITDAIGLAAQDGRLVIERRALGGNTVSSAVINSPHQVIAVMPKLLEPEEGGAGSGEVITAALDLEAPSSRLVERRPKEAGTVNIEEAEILICVGRGLASEDDLSLVQELADALGGAVGCTRPISHENHWLPEDQMVGLSGKIASPRLYIGIGLSGQIQHTVGILDSKVIVAINSDPNAPIFKIADYGVVGDLRQVIPGLIEQIQAG